MLLEKSNSAITTHTVGLGRKKASAASMDSKAFVSFVIIPLFLSIIFFSTLIFLGALSPPKRFLCAHWRSVAKAYYFTFCSLPRWTCALLFFSFSTVCFALWQMPFYKSVYWKTQLQSYKNLVASRIGILLFPQTLLHNSQKHSRFWIKINWLA